MGNRTRVPLSARVQLEEMNSVKSAALFRPITAALAVVACAAGLATSARAATPALGCPGAVSKPFARWLDPSSYTLAPGGTFEGAKTTWALSGGAKLVAGNEPFKVHAATDSVALTLAAGASATSPSFCVGLGYPTLRFFARGGSLLAPLRVDAIYPTVLGTVTQPIGVVLAQPSWSPTLPQLVLVNVTGLLALNGLTSNMQLRFTAMGNAAWTVDDVYVDPWKVT